MGIEKLNPESVAPPNTSPPENRFLALVFSNLILSASTLFMLAAIGWYGYATVEREMKDNLSEHLQVILSSNVKSLQIWIQDKKMDAEVLASQPEIRKKIISLIHVAQKEDVSADVLKTSEDLKWLREHLGNACLKYGFVEFVILDPTGFQVGSLLDDVLGKRQLIERSDFFYRSLQGDTTVSHPFPGEVDLPDNQGNRRPNRPTMFVSSPIQNNTGEVLGVLAFRFRPEMEFTRMLDVGHYGKTGESFAFNDEGFLLTQSRFFYPLKHSGPIPRDSEGTAILSVQLLEQRIHSNPKGNSPGKKSDGSPLTRMAASAVKGESGVDVDGYFGYRGELMVGAWTWLPDQNMGIATEIEAQEAFRPLHVLSKGFLGIFGLLIVATLVAFFTRQLQMRTLNERNRAQEHAREKEVRIRALVDYALDSIITINRNGTIETFNPAAERLFGYKASEVVTKNFSMLMPQPYRTDYDRQIKQFPFTGKSKVLMLNRELQGMRKDGSVFYLELSLNSVVSEDNFWLLGILRNITERKNSENKLRTQAKQKGAVNKLSGIALPGNDLQELMDHTTHLINRTLKIEYSQVLKHIPKEGAFLLQAGCGWKEGLVGKARIPDDVQSQAGYTLMSQGPVVVADNTRESRFSFPRILSDHAVASGMSVVIYAGTRVFGVLGVHTKKIKAFTMDEIHFLQSVANILGSAIERKNSEIKLARKAKELQRSNQELEDFAFIASHDLQEPLRKVMLFGDRIKSVYPSDADHRGKDYIDRLQKSMHKMQNFIHDLLEYSTITRPSAPLKMENLGEVVSESLSNLEAQIKHARGEVEILPLPTVKGDRFQLGQLFQNLISNALKYARENATPKIKISSRPNGESAWDILVEDNGIGIDPKYFNKIFKPFERLHSSDRYGGTGIGLAICSKVLTRHGGVIRIESQPGSGSTFIITLPKIQTTAFPSEKTRKVTHNALTL